MAITNEPMKRTEWFFRRNDEELVKVPTSDPVKNQPVPVEAEAPPINPQVTEELVNSPQKSEEEAWKDGPDSGETGNEAPSSYYVSSGRLRSLEERRLRREADHKTREENRPEPRCADWNNPRHDPYRLTDEQLKEMTEDQLIQMSDEELDALRPDQFQFMTRKLTLRRYMHLGHSEEYTKYLLQDYEILSPSTPPDSPGAILDDTLYRLEILRRQYPLSYKTLDEYRTLADLEYSMTHESGINFDFIGDDETEGIMETIDGGHNGHTEDDSTELHETGDHSTEQGGVAEAGQNDLPGHDGESIPNAWTEEALTDEAIKDSQSLDNNPIKFGNNMGLGNRQNTFTSIEAKEILQSGQDADGGPRRRPEGNEKDISEADDGWVTEPEDGKLPRSAVSLWSLWKKARRNMRRRPHEFLFQVLLGFVLASLLWGILFLLVRRARSSELSHEGIMRARIISDDAMFFEGVVVANEPGTLANIEAGARRFLELTLGV